MNPSHAVAVTCPWCGAPLPEHAVKESAAQPFIRCAYCSATSDLAGGRATKAQPAEANPLRLFCDASFLNDVAAAFEAARSAGAPAHEALVAVARAKLEGMQGEAFANVCLALAGEFDAANGTDTVHDGKCLARLINDYLLAIEGIRTDGDYEVNLPFFAVTPAGLPVHLQRTLTADAIAELAQPRVAAQGRASAQEPASEPANPPPKKWRFWPFGS